jgi:hypothetical protein
MWNVPSMGTRFGLSSFGPVDFSKGSQTRVRQLW